MSYLLTVVQRVQRLPRRNIIIKQCAVIHPVHTAFQNSGYGVGLKHPDLIRCRIRFPILPDNHIIMVQIPFIIYLHGFSSLSPS